jgi:hypothetical protein
MSNGVHAHQLIRRKWMTKTITSVEKHFDVG